MGQFVQKLRPILDKWKHTKIYTAKERVKRVGDTQTVGCVKVNSHPSRPVQLVAHGPQ